MKPKFELEIVDLAVRWVKQNMQTSGNRHVELTGDTDLMESGLLDSVGFVELIVFIESQTGCNIDLTDVDPSEFTTMDGLCRIALRNYQAPKTMQPAVNPTVETCPRLANT
ncbi:MAG: acyl carrier protein [Verrucomicrobia bacterium]|nr:acyl carrier protein [Verrucomicrobiota bacterium]